MATTPTRAKVAPGGPIIEALRQHPGVLAFTAQKGFYQVTMAHGWTLHGSPKPFVTHGARDLRSCLRQMLFMPSPLQLRKLNSVETGIYQ